MSQRFFYVNIYMENTSITVSDLNTMKNIIDLAVRRGAYQASEIKQVGEVYEKLSAFLDAVVAQAQAQQADASTEADQTQGE